MQGRVKRETWLAAIFTALFVLQAPLCAAACLRSVDHASEAATSGASDAGHACHDEGSAPEPAEPPSAHQDCGCTAAAEVLISQPSDLPSSASPAILPPWLDFGPRDRRVLRDLSIVDASDRPPPDLLLLHAILIV